MAFLGKRSSMIVPRRDREAIRRFYCEVLGGAITNAGNDKDIIRLGTDDYLIFLYGEVPDASEFLRTARSVWLEIRCDDTEEMKRRILDFGVLKLDVPDSHLFFQAPGGQCWKLVGIDED